MDNRYNLYNLEASFRKYLSAVNKSSHTIKNYLSDFRHFTAWLRFTLKKAEEELEISKIDKETVGDYKSYLVENTIPQKTVNRRLSTLRIFFGFCISQGWIKENPAKKIENLKLETRSSKLDIEARNSKMDPVPSFQSPASSFSLKHYIGFSVLAILFILIIGGVINRFSKRVKPNFAAASSPLRGSRTLSFQGRLTDSLGNPITTSTTVQFKLYKTKTGGTSLYTSGSCSVTPDQDGIFSAILGSDCGTEIGGSVFSENANVYLGVTIGSDSEMTPRQQIANVGYAVNAEFLQGLPPGTGTSNVPYINSSGKVLITAASPTIESSSGTFTLQGKALTISTNETNGDINISPASGGDVLITSGKLGIGTSSPTSALTVGNNNDAFQVNNSGDIVKVKGIAYSWPTSQGSASTVLTNDGSGNLTWGTGGGATTTGWTDDGTVVRLTTSTDNVTIGSATSLAKLGVDGDTDEIQLLVQGHSTQTSNLVVFENSDGTDLFTVTNAGNTTINGNTTLGDTSGDTVTANAASWTFANDTNLVLSGGVNGLSFDTSTLSIDATNDRVGVGTTAPDDSLHVIGQLRIDNNSDTTNKGCFRYNGTLNEMQYSNDCSTFQSFTASAAGGWTDDGTVVRLTTSTDNVTVGSATELAKLGIDGDTDEIQLLAQGNSTQTSNLVVFENSAGTDLLTLSGGGNLTVDTNTLFVDAGNDRVGVGNIAPSTALHVTGNARITGLVSCDTIDTDASGNLTCGSDAGAIGSGGWTDDGTMVRLTTSTDNVTVGSATELAKLGIDGDTDEIQLLVQGNSTQTSNLVVFENSAGTDLFTVTNTGDITIAGTLTANGAVAFNPPSTSDITFTTDSDSTFILAGLSTSSGTSLCVDGSNNVIKCTAGSSAATLQSAYDQGNTITTTTARDIEITLADVATDTTLEVTQAGTADIVRFNDDGTFTDTTPFVVDASGNVGIGDTSPLATLTVGSGDLFQVAGATGNITTAGDMAVNGGDITTTTTSFNLINATATTLNIGGAATLMNIAPTGSSGSIVLSGGAGDTGCTLDGTTGGLTCSGNITGGGTGTQGFWTRSGTTLSPATSNDIVSISSNTTTSNVLTLAASAITSGNVLDLSSTSTGATGSDLIQGDHTATYSSSTTVSGNILDLSRALTISGANTLTVNSPVATISDNCTTSGGGTCTHSGDVLLLTQDFSSSSGVVLNIDNGGSGLGLRVNDDGTSSDSTPFVVDASGSVGIGDVSPDAKVDIELGAAEKVLIDAASTDSTVTTGAFDINVDSSADGNIGFNLDYTTVDDNAVDTLIGSSINFTHSSNDGDTVYALRIYHPQLDSTTTEAVDALLLLDNADTSGTGSTTVEDALRITNSGNISGGIVTAIDIDDTDITTDIELQNAETIDNNVDGTIQLTATTTALSGDLTVSGGDITGANSASIDLGEQSLSDIVLSANGTSTGEIFIGSDSTSTTPDILVLGRKSDAGNPTGTTGGLYYNDSSSKFFFFDGAWKEICNKTDQACGTGSGSSWSALTDPSTNLTLAHAEFTTAFTWDTAATAAAKDYFTLSVTNDASTDSNTQRLLVLQNNDTTGSTATERLLVLNNADTNETVDTAIEIMSAGGTITNALDVSDTEIVNGLNIGANNLAFADGSSFNITDNASSPTNQFTFKDNTNALGGGVLTFARPKTDTGDPATCSEGDLYYNSFDDTFKLCHSGNTWEALDGTATAWSSLADPTSNLTLNHADFTTSFNWDTSAASDRDYFKLALTNDIGTNTQRLFRLVNNDSTGVTESLISLDNADTSASSVTDGILITSSGVDGGIVDGIDASDGNITNAINVGANVILGTTANIDLTNFDVFGSSGAVIITGSGLAEGTNALTITLGAITLTDGDLNITSGEISATSDDTTGTNFSFTAGATTGTGLGVTGNSVSSGKLIAAANSTTAFTGNAVDLDIATNQSDRVEQNVGGSFTNNTTEANSLGGTAFNLLNTGVQGAGDGTYFMDSATFSALNFDVATAGVGATLVVEYCSVNADTATQCDTWSSVSGLSDGTSNYTVDGRITWTDPGAGWISSTETSGNTGKWLRIRSSTNPTTAPTANYATISIFSGNFLLAKNAGGTEFTIDYLGNIINTDGAFIGLGSGAGRLVFTDAATDEIDVQNANLDLNNNIIINIGNTGTDFDTSGGLTLAGTLTANGAVAFNPPSTSDITFTTDSDSTFILAGLSTSSGTSLCVDGSNNVIKCTAGSSAASLQSAYDNGGSITTTDARDIDITLADTTTDSNLDIDIGADNTISISRLDNASTEAPTQLLLLENLDTNLTVDRGINFNVVTGGVLNAAIDASDVEIVNAIDVGGNIIAGGAAAISFNEFSVSGSTGSITINDDGDAGRVSVEGTVLDINELTFIGAGLIASTGANAITLNSGSNIIVIDSTDTTLTATGLTTITTASTLNLEPASGTSYTLATAATTLNLFNTAATTVNFAGASTALTIGALTGTTTIRNATTALTGILDVNGGDGSDFAGSVTFNDDIDLILTGTENLAISSSPAADSAGTNNATLITLSTPVDTTGTNTHQALFIDPTIGNATGGTNTVNLIATDAVTGDAEVTLTGINIGALTGTTAAEHAIIVGAGWDSAFRVGSTTVINGSGQVVSSQITGTLFTLDGDDADTEAIVQGNTLLVAGGTNGIDTDVSATDTVTLNLDTTEVGTTTFGSGSGFTWTFDAGATDPTIAFGSDSITLSTATVTGTLTANGTLDANGQVDLGDGGDAITISGTTVTVTANSAGNDITLNLVDNNTDALDIQQGTNNYININTTDLSENISFGNATTNPTYNFLGTGVVTIAGSADGTNALVLTLGDIEITNGDLDVLDGDFNVDLDAGDGVNITKGAAPTVDVFSINGGISATAGVDALQITFDSSNASGNAVDITLSGIDGDGTDTTIGIDLDAFTYTSSAGTNTVQGLAIGNLTEAGVGATTSTAISVGTGWDTGIALNSGIITSTTTITLDSSGIVQLGTDDDFLPQLGAGDADIGATGTRWDNIFAVGGNFSGTITGNDLSCTDCLDFTEFANSMSLDEATTITNALSANLDIDLTSTGDFTIEDSNVAFVQFLDDGTITLGKASAASTINIGTGTGVDTINIGTGATAADVITFGNTGVATTVDVNSGAATVNAIDLTVNSLTSGSALAIASTATGFTDTDGMLNVVLSGNNAANTGTLFRLASTGALSAPLLGHLSYERDNNSSTPDEILRIERKDPNAPSNGFGGAIDFFHTRGDLNVSTNSARLASTWSRESVGTFATDSAHMVFYVNHPTSGGQGTLDEGARLTSLGRRAGDNLFKVRGMLDQTYNYYFTDFFGDITSVTSATVNFWEGLRVTETTSAAGSGCTASFDQTFTNGLLSLLADVGAGIGPDLCYMDFNDSINFSAASNPVIEIALDSDDSQESYLGFSDRSGATSGDPANGIYFKQTGGNYFAVTRKASSETSTDTGIDPGGGTLRIEVSSSIVRFYINGILKATHATNIPTVGLDLDFEAKNTNNAGGIGLNFDYIKIWQDPPAPGSGQESLPQSEAQQQYDPVSGADLAERYPVFERNFGFGELVSIDPERKGYVKQTSKAYDSTMLGVTSETPGQVLGQNTNETLEVALQGRVPVKISSTSAPIRAGDFITSSDEPGKGMKATKGGYVIGKALEDYDPLTSSGQVLVFIDRLFYYPEFNLTSIEGFEIIPDQAFSFQLLTSSGSLIDRIEALGQLIAANIKAGLIESQEVKTNRLITPVIETSTIKPANGQDLVIDLGEVETASVEAGLSKGALSKLIIKGFEGKTVATIDATGAAYFAHSVTTKDVKAEKLTADEIESRTTEELKDRLVRLANDSDQVYQELAEIKNRPLPDAKYYQNLDTPISNFQSQDPASSFINNLSSIDAFISHSLSVDNLVLTGHNISSLDNTLNFFGGVVEISNNGTLKARELIAEKIIVQDATLTNANIDIASINELNIENKYLQATDSSTIIAAPENYEKNGVLLPAIETQAQIAGIGVLPANSKEVIIYNNKIADNSLVYITPTSSTFNLTPYVSEKSICKDRANCTPSFKVGVDGISAKDINFNWIIIN